MLSNCVFMCMYSIFWACLYGCGCPCLQRPETNICIFLDCSSPLFLGPDLSLHLKSISLTREQPSGSSFVFIPSCGIRHTSCCICPFVWGLGTRAFVLMFTWQVLYQLSNLQILQNFLLIPLINACSLMTPLHAESDGDIWHTRRLILFTSKYPSLTCESLIRLLEMLVRTPGMLIPCLSYANGNQMLPSICPVEPDVT